MGSTRKAYRVIVADPPWQFRDNLPGPKRGATKQYKTMPWQAIAQFQLPPMDESCVLFMWRVAAMQEEALAVVRSWGFVPKSEIVWVKEPTNAFFKTPRMGMGRYVRHAHEVCVIATRAGGRVPKLQTHRELSVFSAPYQGEHSRKPDEFFEKVARMYAGPRASLFERYPRNGFDCYGDELGKR